MIRRATCAALAAAALLCTYTSTARATHYSLYVHGRTTNGTPGGWSYWGGPRPGVNAVPVNYDGGGCIGAENGTVRGQLDQYCTGEDWCYLACHSAGCAHVGYALDKYGVLDDGSRRWNVKWIDAAGSAEGGSELANVGAWATSDCMSGELRTGVVRSLYDHDDLRGVWSYMYAGAGGAAWSGVLPGQDDEVVAYHSSGGVGTTGSWCNPGDWMCGGTLELGTQSPLYAYHYVYLRDDGEAYKHFVGAAGGGILGPLYDDMAENAR